MNAEQNAAITMFMRVKLVFDAHNSLFNDYEPLQEQIDLFKTEISGLDNYIQQQGLDSVGVTDDKSSKKKLAIDLLMPMIRKGRSYARKVKDTNLAHLLDVVEADFKGDELVAVNLGENIIKAIEANLKNLEPYNVTESQVTAGKLAIDAFKAAVGTPQQQIDISKVATANLNKGIKNIKKILVECDDLLIGEFATTNKNEVAEYKAARKIGSSVGQHTAIIAHIYADSEHLLPIEGAIGTIAELKKTDDSDENGLLEISKFKAGTYTLLIKAKGFADKEIKFTVKSGKRVEVDVVMGE
jgi:hypothetical protein